MVHALLLVKRCDRLRPGLLGSAGVYESNRHPSIDGAHGDSHELAAVVRLRNEPVRGVLAIEIDCGPRPPFWRPGA